MSIKIKSDELNLLIYKYLLESNLAHSAYTLFNEASIEQSIAQYKYDMKSGHLVSLLEKALIFSQIESHVTMTDYEECKEPFYLLKSHVCRISEKIKEEQQKSLEELNDQIYSSMRRTNNIHNTLAPNKDYEDIIYEQRSSNFFEKVKLRVSHGDWTAISGNEKMIAASDALSQCMSIISINENAFHLVAVLPCFVQGRLRKLTSFKLANNYLIRVYEDNDCEITEITNRNNTYEIAHVCLFKLPLAGSQIEIKLNQKFRDLVAFLDASSYCIIHISNKKCLSSGLGKFEWVSHCEYLVSSKEEKCLFLHSLKDPQLKRRYILYSVLFKLLQDDIEKISVSVSEIYFLAESLSEGIISVYTFDHEEPLYIFGNHQPKNGHPQLQQANPFNENPSESSSPPETTMAVKKLEWASVNAADVLIFLTSEQIKVFEIELNNYSKLITISNYDKNIFDFNVLKKNESDNYAVFVGSDNILFYDVALGKIERVQRVVDQEAVKPESIMYPISKSKLLGVKISNSIYMLADSDLQSLFA